MSFWSASAEAGPSRSPYGPTKPFTQRASSPTKMTMMPGSSFAPASKHESHVPTFLLRSATDQDLANAEPKSLHTFAYGGMAQSSPSAESTSAFSPSIHYRTTFSNPSSSSISSAGHPRSASHRNSFSSVSVSELGSSAMSDRLSWGRGLKRQSKRSSHDAKAGGSLRTFDSTRKDGGRLRSHTEGSQFSNPNSGDIFLYSSRNLDANSDGSQQPRFLHQRRKSDGPQRYRLDIGPDSSSYKRGHRMFRSQSSNSLSHAFFDTRTHKHQSKNSAHSLSLVKDEDEEDTASASGVGTPGSPLRDSETLEDWYDHDVLPPSWRRVDDQDALDRQAIMASSASSKTLRRRSGEIVNVAARSAAQATKKGLRVIRRAGSFDVGSKTSAQTVQDRHRSRSNSSSSLFANLGLVPRLDLRHQRSQTLQQLEVPEAAQLDTAEKGQQASLSLPTSVTHSPKLHGLGLSGEGIKIQSSRFSQITEADDEDKSFSKELPQIPSSTQTTPSTESDQELQLRRSNSSDGIEKEERGRPTPITVLERTSVPEQARSQPKSPSRSESDRRHGLAKRSYAALIDLLNPTLHKDAKPPSRGRQASLGGVEPVRVLAQGDNGGRSTSSGAGASGGSSGGNSGRARGNSGGGRSNGMHGAGGGSSSGGGGGAGQLNSGNGGGGPPDRRGGPPRGAGTGAADAAPPVNSVYRRLELVGRGAYGAVYRGVHVETGAAVALKVVNLDTPDDDVSDIQREVALLSQLREAASKNVVRYWGCWLKGPELWIVMDFAEGGSVRTLMKAGPIAERYCAVIVRETLVALNYLHKSGIIHRDIKAANILLTSTGRILLCDFGVAASLASNSVHSKRSTFVGTPYWMAPEVITEGKTYDQKADVWSLGITIYEMATGNPPLADVEQMRVIMLIPKSKPPRLPAEGDFSPAMRDFVAACLNEEPKERATSEELNKLKWIKTFAKTPSSVLKDVIRAYNAWTKAGGMRMSLIGAQTADWGEAGSRDSFAFDGREMGEGWEFNTLRSVREWDEEEGEGEEESAPIPIRDHPLLRLFDVEDGEGAVGAGAGGGGYAQRGGVAGDGGVNAATWRQAAPPGEASGTLRAQQAPPQLKTQPSSSSLSSTAAAATAAASTVKPGLVAHAQEKASFTGTGNTPFRFGVAAPVPPSPLNEVAPARANLIMRKRSQSLTKPSSTSSASATTEAAAIVIPDSRSLHDLNPAAVKARPPAAGVRMGRAESNDHAPLGDITHHRQSHGGSDPTFAGDRANSRLARLRAGYAVVAPPVVAARERKDSGSTNEEARSVIAVQRQAAPAVVLEKGPELRPLDFEVLKTKDEVAACLGRTVDELGRWLDVVSFGLGRAVNGDV